MIHLTIAALILGSPPASDKTMSDLAKSVSEITKRPAISVVPTYLKIAMPETPKTVDDIVDPLKKDGFVAVLSDVGVVYQLGIPRSHWGILKGLIEKEPKPNTTPKMVAIPQTAVKDNFITFETKDTEVVRLGSLPELDLPRRLIISPYFNFEGNNDFPLTMTAKNMDAGDFAKALARGLGAKLKVDPKSYTLAFDPQSFRINANRLINQALQGVDAGRQPSAQQGQFQEGGSYEQYQEYQNANQPTQSNSKPALKAALNLLSQTINQMNDQLLEQTFAYKSSSTRLNLGSFMSLQNSAVTYMEAATAQQAQSGADNRRPGQNQQNLRALVRQVDPRDPGKLIITTDFRLTLELNVRRPQNQRVLTSVDSGGENTVTIQVL